MQIKMRKYALSWTIGMDEMKTCFAIFRHTVWISNNLQILCYIDTATDYLLESVLITLHTSKDEDFNLGCAHAAHSQHLLLH